MLWNRGYRLKGDEEELGFDSIGKDLGIALAMGHVELRMVEDHPIIGHPPFLSFACIICLEDSRV